MWGLAFKPNTDDMREAPSRRVIAELLARGAHVRAYDPVAVAEARRVFALDLHDAPDQLARLTFTSTQDETLTGADALVVVTEWKEFKSPDFAASEISAEVTADFRRPQPVRAGRDDRTRHRLSLDRTTLCPAL